MPRKSLIPVVGRIGDAREIVRLAGSSPACATMPRHSPVSIAALSGLLSRKSVRACAWKGTPDAIHAIHAIHAVAMRRRQNVMLCTELSGRKTPTNLGGIWMAWLAWMA
jgi:hypothetical protein